MRNILQERAKDYAELHGRCKFACDFVDKSSIAGKHILDIGCGFGWFELFALKYSPEKIVGIEPDSHDLEAAQQSVGSPQVVFQTASALSLPFESQTLDTIVCWDVLEHLPVNTESLFFSEIKRVLRPTGHLYLSTPHHCFLSTIFDPAWWLVGHRHYTVKALQSFAVNAGLQVEKVTKRGRVFELLSLWNMYIAKWIFRRGPFFNSFLTCKEDGEYKIEGFMTVFVKVGSRAL